MLRYYRITILLLCLLGGAYFLSSCRCSRIKDKIIPTSVRAVQAHNVSISGPLKHLIQVVDTTYYIKHNPTNRTITMSIRIKVIKNDSICVIKDASGWFKPYHIYLKEEDWHDKRYVYIKIIDELGVENTTVLYLNDSNKKIKDLLQSEVGTQSIWTFTREYARSKEHYEFFEKSDYKAQLQEGLSIVNDIMSSANTFELIDDAFTIEPYKK